MMCRVDTKLLDVCSDLNSLIRHLQGVASILETPRISDTSLLPSIHKSLSSHYSRLDRRTAIRAEMLVLLWLFAPELLTSKRRSPKMLDIAKTMGMKPNNAYAYRKSLMFSYKTYADFRDVVDEGIAVATNNGGRDD